MIPYYVLVGVPIAFTLLFHNRRDTDDLLKVQRHQRPIIFIFFSIFLFLLMFRSLNVGTDVAIYDGIFKSVIKADWNRIFLFDDIEGGFLVFNKIVGMFTNNEHVYVAIVAIISVVPVFICYYKESENALLTMALFLVLPTFQMIFSGFRQAIAIALVIPAYYATKKKKLIPFLLMVLLAFFFHKSALIMVIMYPVYHMNFTRNKILSLIPVLGLVFIFNKQIFGFIVPLMGEKYQERYGELAETNAYMMLIMFVALLAISYLLADEAKMDKNTIGLRNLLIVSVCLQMFVPISNIAMRMNYYFIILIPLLIPKIMNRSTDNNKTACRYLATIMSFFFIIYYLIKANTGEDILEIYPYEFLWDA